MVQWESIATQTPFFTGFFASQNYSIPITCFFLCLKSAILVSPNLVQPLQLGHFQEIAFFYFFCQMMGFVPITFLYNPLKICILDGTVLVQELRLFVFLFKFVQKTPINLHPNILFQVSASIFFPSFSGLL